MYDTATRGVTSSFCCRPTSAACRNSPGERRFVRKTYVLISPVTISNVRGGFCEDFISPGKRMRTHASRRCQRSRTNGFPATIWEERSQEGSEEPCYNSAAVRTTLVGYPLGLCMRVNINLSTATDRRQKSPAGQADPPHFIFGRRLAIFLNQRIMVIADLYAIGRHNYPPYSRNCSSLSTIPLFVTGELNGIRRLRIIGLFDTP